MLEFRAFNINDQAYYSNVVALNFDKEIGITFISTMTGEWFTVWEPEIIIEQFSGLTDKHNIKIFEGDILKDEYGNIGLCYKEIQSFVFLNTSGSVEDGTRWEVIGNKNNNPQLLKGSRYVRPQ